MKKMTKLLSVILAFVMALSCMTMMASAAKANYKTVDDLEGINAYSPYGTVTRLSMEVRTSMVLDALDSLLGSMPQLNMGELFKLTDNLRLSVDLTSVNALFGTVDGLKSLLNNGAVRLVKWMLGTVQYINVDTWNTGMNRESNGQVQMVDELLELLSNNTNLIDRVLSKGIDLGVANSALPDMSGINNFVKDLPGGIKGIVFPMFSRQDDHQADRNTLENKSLSLTTIAQDFVNGLFTKPMNWTSYRVDGDKNDLGYTMPLPTTKGDTTRYFVINDDKTEITQYDYQYAGALGSPKAGFVKTVTYTLSATEEYEGSGTYLYKAPEGYSGDATLKWYKADGRADANGRIQTSYWLPAVKAAFESGTLSLNINGTDSLLGLLYKFVPYIFAEMAPTVLNGSVKKLLAGAFGVSFEHIGSLKATDTSNTAFSPDADLQAVINEVGNIDNFFTKAQEYYVWEYSDYKVINGVPYYRFQNDYYKGTLPKDLSAYYSMFKWDWNIGDDFLNEFLPTSGEIGTKWAVDSLNNLVKKAIDTVIADSWTVKGTTYTKAEVFNWVAGDNSNLINNLKVCARNFFNIAPEEIVDEYFTEAQFYDAMMNTDNAAADIDNKRAVNGLVCELVKLIMPQIKFPDNIVNEPITAIAALVVRELCTQLMPKYNFDAMIYQNYGDSSNKTRAILSGKSADYWLDTTLYMGVNLGMYYLRNIADLGEDTEKGYYAVMANLGALPAATADGMTFTSGSQYVGDTAAWLYAVDWIVDWALADENNILWGWHFSRIIDVANVDLTTYQNPLDKINSVLETLFPALMELVNIDAFDGTYYGSSSWIAKVLKGGLVDSIVNLDVTKLLSLFHVGPSSTSSKNSVVLKNNIADNVVNIVIYMLNSIFYKVAGDEEIIDSTNITSVDTLLNQNNLKTTVKTLVGKLFAASNTYKVLEPLLPLANFFLGWTTDAQKYADPVSSTTNTEGYDYLLAVDGNATTTLTIINNSAGMLLKHRNSTVEDKAYDIKVTSIKSNTGDNITLSKTATEDAPIIVSPYEKTVIDVTIPYVSDKMVDITIEYQFIGKDGAVVGGKRTSSVYKFVSATGKVDLPGSGEASASGTSIRKKPGSWTDYSKTTAASVKHWTYNTIYIVNNLNKVKDHEITFENLVKKTTWTYELIPSADMHSAFGVDTSLVHGETENAELKAERIGFMETSASSDDKYEEKLWRAHAVKLVDESFVPVTGNEYKAGYTVSFINGDGSYGYDDNKATLNVGYTVYYYNVEELEKLVNSAIYAKDVDRTTAAAQTAWDAYLAVLSEAKFLVDGPKNYDTFKTLYAESNVNDVQTRLENAITALEPYTKESINVGDINKVINKLNALETNPDRDINFQDYELFEYFKYEEQRTSARNMIKSTQGPTAPENHIENGVWGNELIEAITSAQTNANITTGINATVVEPTAEELANYAQAAADFKPAVYTALQVQDQVAKLQYYYNFMIVNTKTIDKTFLQKEITYAEAQNYDEALYSADSWSRYVTALATAKDVLANSNKEHEIFDAKYELMLAQNKLQLKERSMKEVGYMNEELVPLIDKANVILNNFGTSASLYTVKAGLGVTDAEALGQLVSALGIEYSVEIDGKTQEGILYDRSALTFTNYDRTATAKNKKAVDMAADKLRAAIENFECTAVIESGDNVTTVDQGVRYVQGIVPNSIPTEAALLERLTVTGGTPVVTVSKAGQFGTGTRIDLKSGEDLLATYFVVIYGDVNGDGAVDAFDALEVDYANCSAYYMGGVYDDAADLDGDGAVTEADYSALVAGVQCQGTISQVH